MSNREFNYFENINVKKNCLMFYSSYYSSSLLHFNVNIREYRATNLFLLGILIEQPCVKLFLIYIRHSIVIELKFS